MHQLQMKLFKEAGPGESVQVDLKSVKLAGRWACQYTVFDDCTRFRVLRPVANYRKEQTTSRLEWIRAAESPLA